MRKWLVMILSIAVLMSSVCPSVSAYDADDGITMEDDVIAEDEYITEEDFVTEDEFAIEKETDEAITETTTPNDGVVMEETEEIGEIVITKEMEALRALEILDVDELTATVTRAQFIVAVTMLCGYDGGDYYADGIFSDVTDDHEFAHQIIYAAGRKLVLGSGGLFRPDDSITQEEIALILLRALGYDSFSPHINMDTLKARREGIFDGVKFKKDGTINFENAAKAIYNTMNSAMILTTGIIAGDESSSLILERGETTALNYYQDIYMYRGIVKDNGISAISGASRISDTEVRIEDSVYKQGVGDFAEFLGRRVEIFFDSDGNILYVCDITGDSERFCIDAADIVSAQLRSIKYEDENNKIRTVSFSDTAYIIYNGKALEKGQFNVELLKPFIGTVELIKTGSSGYDVVKITSQYNCAVSKIVVAEDKFTFIDADSPAKNVTIDTKEIGKTIRVADKYGNAVDCTAIKENDILSAAYSLDKTIISVKVSTHSVRGWVDGVALESKIIDIDGVEYELTYDATVDSIFPGIYGWLHFDIYGRGAYFRSFEKYESRYGYLVGAAVSDGFKSGIAVKIFDPSAQMLTFEATEKVDVDGTKYKAKEFVAAAANFYEDGKFKPQMIKYELNLDGSLKRIDTCGVYDGPDTIRQIKPPKGMDKTNNTKHYVGLRYYFSSTKTFDGGLFFSNDTKIFGIPIGTHDDCDYQILQSGFFTNARFYDVEMYTSDPDGQIAEVMTVKYAAKYDYENRNSNNYVYIPSLLPIMMRTAFVKNVSYVLDKNGDYVPKARLITINNGTEVDLEIRWPELVDVIKKGSVIRYFPMKNTIIDAELVFDLDTRQAGTPRKEDVNTDTTFNVYENGRNIADGNARISTAWGLTYLDVLSLKGGVLTGVTADAAEVWGNESSYEGQIDRIRLDMVQYIARYDSGTKTLEKASTEEILSYEDSLGNCSKILVMWTNTRPNGIIIIE